MKGRRVGVSLVRQHALRSAADPSPGAAAKDPYQVQHGQQLRIVTTLTGRDEHRQRPPTSVDAHVRPGGPPSTGATQTMIIGLSAQIRVIRPKPLCAPFVPQSRADVPARWWSPPTPATSTQLRRAPHPAEPQATGPRCRPWPTGRNATKPFARRGNPTASHAKVSRSETATRSPRRWAGDRSTDHLASAPCPEVAARPGPTSRQSSLVYGS